MTHETTLSGAPRVALMVVRALTAQGHRVRVVARAPGPMLTDFEAATHTSRELFGHIRAVLWSRLPRSRVPFFVDTLMAWCTLVFRRPDLVYLNSTSAAVYMRPALWLGRPVILHVHESSAVAARFLDATRSRALLPAVTAVACSPSVRRDVARLVGTRDEVIPLLPSVPDADTVLSRADLATERTYPPGELVVGCCGTVEHRKGTDLWISAIQKVINDVDDGLRVRFVWVGEIADPALAQADPQIEFVGASSNPYPYMRRFDIATLPSRDDPFPLVVLESMLLGTPVVAFGVGGVPDQIGESGMVVPPEDVDAFASAVRRLVEDGDERRRLGRAAERRVQSLYSTRAFAEGLSRVVDGATEPGPRATPHARRVSRVKAT